MPKVKVPRKSTSIDMTAMCDVAFLLVTFFMLTTKFRPDEPVIVDTPSSVSEIILPEKGVLLLTVDGKGRVFFNVEGQQLRKELIQKMGEHYKIQFTPNEINRFAVLSSVGLPMADMKRFLNAGEEQRKTINNATMGIPHDSLDNQLSTWINV